MDWNLPDNLNFNNNVLPPAPTIEDAENKKKVFGIALGKGKNPFDAALEACGQKTSEALYVSQNWLNDPIVVANKDQYIKAVYNPQSSLDAEQLAARLLEMANEKTPNNMFYVLEGKDRIKCLELYAEIKGMIGKNAQISLQNNITFKSIKLKFVKPEQKEKIIDNDTSQSEISNNNPKVKLKLVS